MFLKNVFLIFNALRCIVGTCTYTLKGPHTSTLACHLKKHPLQYAEFQKLKVINFFINKKFKLTIMHLLN